MKVGSLFSGVGLTDFGLELAGFEHAWFCEIEPYAQDILAKRWPGRTIYKDIKDLDGNEIEKVDLLSGGFPCQDVSCGGKRKGITKETRSGLWYEYARIIRQIQPKYVLIENVPGLRSKGFEIVLKELAAIGYDAEWIVLSAAQFGAPHLRERLLLPTPTVQGMTTQLAHGGYLRKNESMQSTSNLIPRLAGIIYKLTGPRPKAFAKHIPDPSFIEWMMGIPTGWTDSKHSETASHHSKRILSAV